MFNSVLLSIQIDQNTKFWIKPEDEFKKAETILLYNRAFVQPKDCIILQQQSPLNRVRCNSTSQRGCWRNKVSLHSALFYQRANLIGQHIKWLANTRAWHKSGEGGRRCGYVEPRWRFYVFLRPLNWYDIVTVLWSIFGNISWTLSLRDAFSHLMLLINGPVVRYVNTTRNWTAGLSCTRPGYCF